MALGGWSECYCKHFCAFCALVSKCFPIRKSVGKDVPRALFEIYHSTHSTALYCTVLYTRAVSNGKEKSPGHHHRIVLCCVSDLCVFLHR